MAWLAVMSSINVAAQTAVSGWVRARALAVSLLVIQGSMAVGALLWGWVASRIGVPNALLMAAGGARRRPGRGEPLFARRGRGPRPVTGRAGSRALPDRRRRPRRRRPVLVTVEYLIDPACADDFVDAIRRMARIRRRDGAQLWGVFRDAVDPASLLETFTVESWAEHLRQHERITVADRELQNVARGFHVGATRPVVTHYIAAPPREE